MTNIVKGYKVFNPDFTCRGYQFKENETFEMPLPIEICRSGFHFCIKASHCFSYYDFRSDNIVCEVEAIGEVKTHDEDSKVCTNILRVGRRLTWEEVLRVANEGKNNTGHRNTGDRNTGNWNTGDSNTGNWNTGNWNTGNRNTGYSNTGDRNTGLFCTGKAPFPIFNKPSSWTEEDFLNSRAYSLLCQVDTKMWIYSENMTPEEKEKNPSHKTCGGYLKDIPFKEAFQNQWHNWNESNRKAFKDLPNFDAAIFEEITGVKI
jgi:hypothetical protein